MLTARLRIEPLQASHAPLLFPVLADPRIYAYVPDEIHPTVESLAKRYAFLERGAPAGREGRLAQLGAAAQRTPAPT